MLLLFLPALLVHMHVSPGLADAFDKKCRLYEDCEEVCGERGFKTIVEKRKVQCKKDVLATKYTCNPQKYIEGVRELRVNVVNDTEAVVSWKPPVPIKKEVKFEFICRQKDINNLSKIKFLDSGVTRKHHFKLTGLAPGMPYRCEVRTIEIGMNVRRSKYTGVTFRTVEEKPSSPPANLRVKFSDDDRFQLNWGPPKEANGKILGYTIRLLGRNNRTMEFTERSTSFNVLKDITSHLQTNLIRVQVAGINKVGQGPHANVQVLLPPYDDYYMPSNLEALDDADCGEPVAFSKVVGHYVNYCVEENEVGVCNY